MLYGEMKSNEFYLEKNMFDKIVVEKINIYLMSGGIYLEHDIHTQLANFNTSINNKNWEAAIPQIKDIIKILEDRYSCRLSESQPGVNSSTPPASADTLAINN